MYVIGAMLKSFDASKIDSPYAFINKLAVEIYWFVLNVRESPYDTDTKGTNDPSIVWSDQQCLREL